jgi:hypothetical protein
MPFTPVRSARPPFNWMRRSVPRIAITPPASVCRAMKAALRAVDSDIERHGAVSYEAIEQVRAALALARSI